MNVESPLELVTLSGSLQPLKDYFHAASMLRLLVIVSPT